MGGFNFEDRAKPILKWAGGKTSALPQLLPYFPDRFDRYLEPFLGGGAVFLALAGGKKARLNDTNEELVNLYQVVRDDPVGLMERLDELAARYGEDFYYKVRSQRPRLAVNRAARTVFLNKTGFNGLYRQNGAGRFNVPFGKRQRCPLLYERENLFRVSRLLASSEISCGDFEPVLDSAGRGDFVYCDPPYAPLSSTSAFTSYVAGGFGVRQQARLRDACERARARGAVVAVSNSSADSIRELYARWSIHEISVKRAINSRGDRRGVVTEFLMVGGG